MKREVWLLAFALFLPAFMVMSMVELSSPEGRVVNPMAEFRMNRINLWFPYPFGVSPSCQAHVATVQTGIRINSDGKFYGLSGLQHGQEYFDNERVLFTALEKIQTPEPYVQACPFDIETRAVEVRDALVKLNGDLILYTLDNTPCDRPQAAFNYIDSALNASAMHDDQVFLNDFEQSWLLLTECTR